MHNQHLSSLVDNYQIQPHSATNNQKGHHKKHKSSSQSTSKASQGNNSANMFAQHAYNTGNNDQNHHLSLGGSPTHKQQTKSKNAGPYGSQKKSQSTVRAAVKKDRQATVSMLQSVSDENFIHEWRQHTASGNHIEHLNRSQDSGSDKSATKREMIRFLSRVLDRNKPLFVFNSKVQDDESSGIGTPCFSMIALIEK